MDRYARVECAYRDQASKMWHALLGFTGDPEIASDALSEAFARAIRDQDGIRDVTAWTWRVAFRLATAEMQWRGGQPQAEAPPHTR